MSGSNVGFLNLFYFYCLTFWCDIKIFRCTIFSAIEGWIPFISSNLVCYIMNNDFSVSNIYSSYFFYFSIMPETFIEPHKVLSPLPKHLPALQMLVKTKELWHWYISHLLLWPHRFFWCNENLICNLRNCRFLSDANSIAYQSNRNMTGRDRP